MQRLLVVEDDPQIAETVEYILQQQGFIVTLASDGKAGLEAFQRCLPDLVVLDLYLPLMSGPLLFQAMRKLHPAIPVIMLSCQSDAVDRVIGLETGADDFISKPFDNKELVARIRAVLRRYAKGVDPLQPLIEGPVEINVKAQIFNYFGTRVNLTPSEFELMRTLVTKPTWTYSREALMDQMHNEDYQVNDRTVDACVKRIRRKLNRVRAGINPITSIYGVGYKFNEGLSLLS